MRDDHLKEHGIGALDFRALFEATPTPYAVISPPEFTIEAVNDAYLRATAKRREQILGEPLFHVFPDDASDPDATGATSLLRSLRTVVRTKRPDAMPVQKYSLHAPETGDEEAEARWWAVLNTPVLDTDGSVLRVIHRIEDVTEAVRSRAPREIRSLIKAQQNAIVRLREANDALHRESEERRMAEDRLRAVLENSVDAAYRRNFESESYDYLGPATHGVLGVEAETLMRMPMEKVVLRLHPDDRSRVVDAMETAIATGEGRIEYRFFGDDHRYHWVADYFTVQRDESGRPVSRTGVIRNIAARKKAEAERDRQQQAAELANRAKSQFLAVMSHEIRTPLNAILGYTNLLRDGVLGEMPPPQAEYLQRIAANGSHLLTLINDVLDLAKIESGELSIRIQPVLAHAAIQQALAVIEPLVKAKGLSLQGDNVLHASVQVWGDEDRVRQVLVNLLSNASKFTERGTIHLRTLVRARRPAVLHAAHEGPWIGLEVRDTGIGIPPGAFERIFQPFVQQEGNIYTRTHEGTGLGLAISRRLARMMGGDVTVESTEGEGSTFILWLAAVQDSDTGPPDRRTGDDRRTGLKRRSGERRSADPD